MPVEASHIVHMVCAALFFIVIACNSIFQFTKSGPTMTERKKIRNRIYRICGYGMFVAEAAFGVSQLLKAPGYSIMIIEIVLLLLFGFAWLVKGEAFPFLNDVEEEPAEEGGAVPVDGLILRHYPAMMTRYHLTVVAALGLALTACAPRPSAIAFEQRSFADSTAHALLTMRIELPVAQAAALLAANALDLAQMDPLTAAGDCPCWIFVNPCLNLASGISGPRDIKHQLLR